MRTWNRHFLHHCKYNFYAKDFLIYLFRCYIQNQQGNHHDNSLNTLNLKKMMDLNIL